MAKANGERGVKSNAIREYLKEHPKTSTKDVVEALKGQGIGVSEGLVNAVKYRKKGPKRKKGKGPAAKGSRSAAIRDFLAANPGVGTKEVQEALAKEGVKVTVGLISNVKHHFKRKKKVAARKAARKVAPVATTSSLSGDQLFDVKRLADTLGGLQQVRQAVDLLEQLR
ncbi:MAG: hypothetical protein ACKV0T_13585 [Planctomycetales bacterium]